MYNNKNLVSLTPTLPAQSPGASRVRSEIMDDALVISGVFPKKSSTIVENEEWEWGTYSGDWVDGKPHGKGIHTWPDGEVYAGDWVDGKPHGKGTVQHVFNDGVYEGDWVDGCPDGRGIWRWPDGQVYEEDSLNNGQNEKGIDTLPQLDLMSMAGWVGSEKL